MDNPENARPIYRMNINVSIMFN